MSVKSGDTVNPPVWVYHFDIFICDSTGNLLVEQTDSINSNCWSSADCSCIILCIVYCHIVPAVLYLCAVTLFLCPAQKRAIDSHQHDEDPIKLKQVNLTKFTENVNDSV